MLFINDYKVKIFLDYVHVHGGVDDLESVDKKVVVYIPEMVEPELMYKLFDCVVETVENLILKI